MFLNSNLISDIQNFVPTTNSVIKVSVFIKNCFLLIPKPGFGHTLLLVLIISDNQKNTVISLRMAMNSTTNPNFNR